MDDNNAPSDIDNTDDKLATRDKTSLKEKLIEEEEYGRLNFHRDPPAQNYPDTYDTLTVREKKQTDSAVDSVLPNSESQVSHEQSPPTQIQAPPTQFQTPPTQFQAPPAQFQAPPSDEKFQLLEERLKTLEENTSSSLHNIEALLRNAVFSRGGSHPRGPSSAFMQFGSERRY